MNPRSHPLLSCLNFFLFDKKFFFCQIAPFYLNITQVGDRVATVKATDLDSGELLYIYYILCMENYIYNLGKWLKVMIFPRTNIAAEFIIGYLFLGEFGRVTYSLEPHSSHSKFKINPDTGHH